MYLLCFALLASTILTVCASQEAPETDFSQPVSPTVYQRSIKQGFSTNYFKSPRPDRKYNAENIYERGFRNLRLRARTDLYDAPYNDNKFSVFLTEDSSGR